MALQHLNLLVQWPDGRNVAVDVLVLPEFDTSSSSGFRFFKVEGGDLPTEEIGPEDVESSSAAHRFLARLTRSAADDEVRRVSCGRTQWEELLKALKVLGPPPDPISVRLSRDD